MEWDFCRSLEDVLATHALFHPLDSLCVSYVMILF